LAFQNSGKGREKPFRKGDRKDDIGSLEMQVLSGKMPCAAPKERETEIRSKNVEGRIKDGIAEDSKTEQ